MTTVDELAKIAKSMKSIKADYETRGRGRPNSETVGDFIDLFTDQKKISRAALVKFVNQDGKKPSYVVDNALKYLKQKGFIRPGEKTGQYIRNEEL